MKTIERLALSASLFVLSLLECSFVSWSWISRDQFAMGRI